jgi:hypothetical protein
MEKISNRLYTDKLEQIKQKQAENKGKEYRLLWVIVNFATVKDGHIRQIGARAFGVFFVIRAFMDKDGIAYPSLQTIANLSRCCVKTIQKEEAILIQYGWIKKEGRVRLENGRFGNTKYRILEKDLIRGTGQKGFMREPLADNTTGK